MKGQHNLIVNWRIFWYSILVWLLAFAVAQIVILPWFYLVLPIIVFWTTVYYFKRSERTLRSGLWVSLFWFLIIGIFSLLEIVGPYYFDVPLYFSDPRNWFLYPLILLIPVIYSLFLENTRFRKIPKSKRVSFSRLVHT